MEDMTKTDLIEKLHKLSKQATENSVDETISRSDWGAINFIEAQDDMEKVFSIFNNILLLPIDLLAKDTIQNILERGELVLKTLETIRDFTTNQENIVEMVERKNSLINELRLRLDEFHKATHMHTSVD
jgi:hypothetical protein